MARMNPFASRINHQIEKCISWKTEPGAIAIDTYSVKWNTEFYYIFPPFSLLGKGAAITHLDNTNCMMVMPKWKPSIGTQISSRKWKTPFSYIRFHHQEPNLATKFRVITSITLKKNAHTSTPHKLTARDIINASLRNSTCKKCLT